METTKDHKGRESHSAFKKVAREKLCLECPAKSSRQKTKRRSRKRPTIPGIVGSLLLRKPDCAQEHEVSREDNEDTLKTAWYTRRFKRYIVE